MGGWHIVASAVLSFFVALLAIAPIELQRRIIDDAILSSDMKLLLVLALMYGGVLISHQIVKYVALTYRSLIAESAIKYTRSHLTSLLTDRDKCAWNPDDNASHSISIIISEVEKLGAFVGNAFSNLATNVGILVMVAGYMLALQPMLAALGLLMFVPQLVIVPLLQAKLNKLVAKQVRIRRELGKSVAEIAKTNARGVLKSAQRLFRNKMTFDMLKFALKSALNLINNLTPLLALGVGGYFVIQGETSIGVVVAFLSGFTKLSEPARGLITFYRDAHQASVQHDAIAEWIDNLAKRS